MWKLKGALPTSTDAKIIIGARLGNSAGTGKRMAKTNLRPWTKEDVRTLKTLARQRIKTTAIARRLGRTAGATYQKAWTIGVTLGRGRRKQA
jgi:hypothetical protein